VCAWGFFECRNDPEAAEALFGAVQEWATRKGMTFLRGPLNPSTNYEVGLLVEGFEHPPSLMMPYNPVYYAELIERFGFAKEKDLFTLILDRNRRISERMVRLTRRIARNKNVSIRNAEKKNFASEMKLIGEIYNASWSRNWGFVPMTEAELLQMGKDLIRIADTDGLFFIYYYGEPVGVTIALPDVGPLLKRLNGNMGFLGILRAALHRKEIRGARVVAMGFKKTHQGLGLPILACDHLMKVWDTKDMDYIEVGWNLEDNHSIIEIEMEFGARAYKRHRVFRKDIVLG